MKDSEKKKGYVVFKLDKGKLIISVAILISAFFLVYFIGYYAGKQKYTDAAYNLQNRIPKDYPKDISDIEEEISSYRHKKALSKGISLIDKEIEQEILESLKGSKIHKPKAKPSLPKKPQKNYKKIREKKETRKSPKKINIKKRERHYYVKESPKEISTTLKPYDPYLHNKKGYYSIQLGAYKNYKDALTEKQKVSGKYPAYICKTKVGEEIVYRVRVGPFNGLSKALVELQHIRKFLDRENIYVVSK
jgi:hypothetical protein